MIELIWNDYGLWTNTKRVDSYQYPMGLEVWGGNSFYKKVGEIKTHEEIQNDWINTVSTAFLSCYDANMGVIHAPLKLDEFRETGQYENYFDTYNY